MIERFKNIFTGLERAHGVTIAEDTNGNGTKIKGKSFVKRQPVTDELWQKHLDGKENLGIIPINDDNQCRWGCIDIDQYNLDHKEVIKNVKKIKAPMIVFRSKSGGAHVFLFTKENIPVKLVEGTVDFAKNKKKRPTDSAAKMFEDIEEDDHDEEFEFDEKGLLDEDDADNDVVFGDGQIDSKSINRFVKKLLTTL